MLFLPLADAPTDDVGIEGNDLTYAAFVLPPVISLINQRTWPREVKGLVALGVCLAYSAGAAALRPGSTIKDWRNVMLQVMVTTFAAYKLFWNPSNLMPRFETATTFTRMPPGTVLPPATLDDQPGVTPAGDPAAIQDQGESAGDYSSESSAGSVRDVRPEDGPAR